MRLTVVLFLTLKSLIIVGQGNVFIGEKRYDATNSISFLGNGGFADLTIQLAKKNDGSGLILLSKETHTKHEYVGGTIWIYLDDGRILKCFDKGTRDYANQKSTTIYYLTKQEVDILKEINIKSIRYSTKCSGGVITGSCDENYISENKISFMEPEGHDLPLMLKELYNECYAIEGFNEVGDKILNYPPKLVNTGSFEEYAIGLSTNGDEKYISLIHRNTLVVGSDDVFANELVVSLVNGTKLNLRLINSKNQTIGGDKALMGIYYLEPQDVNKLLIYEIKSIKIYKKTRDPLYGTEKISESSFDLKAYKNLLSKYLKCSIH